MNKIILIPHPDKRDSFYNINHIVKIEKESLAIYWFTFLNGERVRIFDIDSINKIREYTDIRF